LNINKSYCSYKLSFGLEPYLEIIKEPKYRNALARLRTSSHDLKIEKGRHHNIQREHKFCENCNQKQIENEYHFLLICPKYMELRKKYLKKFYYTWPTVHKFKCLLSQTAPKHLNNLGKYIYILLTN